MLSILNKNLFKDNNLYLIMENKRGQGLSTNAIIMIILGVAILVILIVGFTYVWGGLGERIQKDNIATIVSACQTSCSTQAVYDFCSKQQELIDENGRSITTSCSLLAGLPEFQLFGLDSCPAIDCKVECGDLKIDGKAGTITQAPVDTDTHYYLSNIAFGLDKSKDNCSIAK
jgi:hypothetical protein